MLLLLLLPKPKPLEGAVVFPKLSDDCWEAGCVCDMMAPNGLFAPKTGSEDVAGVTPAPKPKGAALVADGADKLELSPMSMDTEGESFPAKANELLD